VERRSFFCVECIGSRRRSSTGSRWRTCDDGRTQGGVFGTVEALTANLAKIVWISALKVGWRWPLLGHVHAVRAGSPMHRMCASNLPYGDSVMPQDLTDDTLL
jgi:hypothetical protein